MCSHRKGEFTKFYTTQNHPRFGILRDMRISNLPSTRTNAQTPRIVVVQEKQGTGCLPVIIGVVLILLAIILLYVIFVIGGCSLALSRYAQEERDKAAQSSAPTATPTAAPTSKPQTVDLYAFQESKDAMTDAARYLFVWKSEKSRGRFSLADESLVLRFSPTQVARSTHKMKYDIECIIHADFSYVGRDKTTATVRFDDKPARAWKCSPSTTGEGLFIDDARGFLSEIAYARRCRVRFDDFGGQQHDLDFNLGFFSLQNFREKIVDCVLKSNPPNVKIVD